MSRNEKEEAMKQRIVEHMVDIEGLFKGNVKLTFIAHNFDSSRRNMMVTNDPEIKKVVTAEFLATMPTEPQESQWKGIE